MTWAAAAGSARGWLETSSGRDRCGPARSVVGPPQAVRTRASRPESEGSGLAEDAVEVGAAHGALALGHPTAVVRDDNLALGLTLLLALDAVELALVGLVSHSFSFGQTLAAGTQVCAAP